jgi:hypothetical protein
MAPTEVQIGGGEVAKVRNPVTTAILSFVTIGIYYLYWYYSANKELAALGREKGTEELGTNPTNSFLALFPGGIVLVPALISEYNTGERIEAAQRLTGVGESVSSAVFVVLAFFFFPAAAFYGQQELNKVWERQTGAELPSGLSGTDTGAGPQQPAAQEQPQQPAQ